MAQRHVRSLLLVALLASAFLAVTVRASLSREELVEHLMEGEELDEHGQPIIVRNRNKVKRVRIGGHPGRAQHGSVVLAVFPSSSSFFFFFLELVHNNTLQVLTICLFFSLRFLRIRAHFLVLTQTTTSPARRPSAR